MNMTATARATLTPAYATREEWLVAALPILTDWIRGAGAPLFAVPLVSIGFPSKGGLGKKKRTRGQCWTIPGQLRSHIFVSPVMPEPDVVLLVLLHEIIHAAVPDAGHKGPFKTIANAAGLVGKMTTATPSDELKDKLLQLAADLGIFPHPGLSAEDIEKASTKQGTRMLKIYCPRCDYTCRSSAKWIAIGLPTCVCGEEMVCDEAADCEPIVIDGDEGKG